MLNRNEPDREVAFYYPGHLWHRPEWIKTMLLFFDGVGLLIPEYKQGEPEMVDPVLAGPLRDQGLLHYLATRFLSAHEEFCPRSTTIGHLTILPLGLLPSYGPRK